MTDERRGILLLRRMVTLTVQPPSHDVVAALKALADEFDALGLGEIPEADEGHALMADHCRLLAEVKESQLPPAPGA